MFNLFKKKEVAEALKNLTAALADEANAKEYSETEVKISDKSVGGKVELVDADGNLVPAPDGDMKVSGDDNVYTVKDGQIAAINGETPSEETPKEEVEASEEAPVEETKPNEEMEALKAEVEALKAAVAEMQNMIAGFASKEDVAQFSSEVKTLNETIVKLAKIPAEVSKTNKSTVVKESNKESLKQFKELFSMKN